MFDERLTLDEVNEVIAKWNLEYPLDHWYRKKYNIPFNSKKHREANIQDIYFEYMEEKLYSSIYEKALKKENVNDRYEPGQGNFLKSREDEFSQSAYDNLNLDEIKL